MINSKPTIIWENKKGIIAPPSFLSLYLPLRSGLFKKTVCIEELPRPCGFYKPILPFRFQKSIAPIRFQTPIRLLGFEKLVPTLPI